MKPLSIGITCYPSVGGSGIVASQLGSELARLGHKVHFISYEPPFRLDRKQPNVFFHQVELNEYKLFKYPDYTLPLAVKMVEVADKHKLDILHVHYAVPHATAALLATQIARDQNRHAPHVITTLHGTDITLLARDPNLKPIIKYSIRKLLRGHGGFAQFTERNNSGIEDAQADRSDLQLLSAQASAQGASGGPSSPARSPG